MGKMTTLTKLLLFAVILIGTVFGAKHLMSTGVIPRPNVLKSVVPLKSEEITATVITSNPGNVPVLPLPSSNPVPPCIDGNTHNCLSSTPIHMEHWGWNANAGLDYAVGGAPTPDGKGIMTSKNSLMEKYKVNLTLVRQDDSDQMATDLVDTAKRLKSDPNANGIYFVSIMGDGGAAWFAGVKKLCPECKFEIIAENGYSNGEDSFLGPVSWKTNCEAMRGGLVVGVVHDGDWNIALKKAAQCGVSNNPDEKVFDPKSLNWIPSKDYKQAAADFAASNSQTGPACVDLPIKGKIGGGKIHKCADAVVTWTPGDVTVATQRGGVVPILSTRESIFQMPSVIIGIAQWDAAHADDVMNMLHATLEGADQIRVNPKALARYGEIAVTLYKEQTPEYWVKYYRGVTEPDKTGAPVALGGSRVSNLADNIQAFGIGGGTNLVAATFDQFGRYDVQQYPNLYKDVPLASTVINTTYLQRLQGANVLPTNNAEDLVAKDTGAAMKSVEGNRNYSIQFASGRADILASSYATLDNLAQEIEITKYAVALHGYTDAAKWTGFTPEQSAEKNFQLSNDRAHSVEAYLHKKGLKNPVRVYPHGEEDPLSDNTSEAGRAANRRVKVVLGTL